MADTIVVPRLTIRVNEGDKIEEFFPLGDDFIYLRIRDGRWYFADLPEKCGGFSDAVAKAKGLKIVTRRRDGAVDGGSVVEAAGKHCRINSIISGEDGPGAEPLDRRKFPDSVLRNVSVEVRR